MRLSLIAAVIPLLALGACVAPTGPIEVTRFHVPETAELGHGTIAVVAAPGMDAKSLELRSFQAAVARELQRIGYGEGHSEDSRQVAEVRLERRSYRPGRSGSPVSVGVGGATGSYGSGVGVGLGFDLSGPPPEMTETRLGVMIRDRETNEVLWEGRASFTVKASSPLASTQLGAAQMAAALFKDFPGNSGETVLVKATPAP